MNDPREIQLSRDVDAVQIPSGSPITLPLGTAVMITQSLGGTYTVATQSGLARIDAKDADALGIDPDAEPAPKQRVEGPTEDAVWAQLKTVFDPEIPVNVVDLGLIYDCSVLPSDAGSGSRVQGKMTLTAPGCGMGPTIAADARSKILTLEGIDEAEVELVWEPAWNQGMISEAGRMKLGLV